MRKSKEEDPDKAWQIPPGIFVPGKVKRVCADQARKETQLDAQVDEGSFELTCDLGT